MPVLPDKFSLKGTAVPDGQRPIANISFDSPLYAAGEKFGNAITGLGQKLREPAKKEQDKPVESAKTVGESADFVQGVIKDAQGATDPGQKGIELSDRLNQGEEAILARLSPQERPQREAGIRAIFASGRASLEQTLQPLRVEAKVAEVESLMAPGAVNHARFSDDIARGEVASPVYRSIDALWRDGVIDENRATALKDKFQRLLIEEDLKAFPLELRIAMLQKREGGEDKQSFFRQKLGEEKSDLMLAQALEQKKADKRDGAAQSLLDRFGTAPENESKALAEIDAQHGGDPTLKRFYLGRLQMQRRQERRDVAQSARNVYALALEGRQSEIEAADLQRLHAGGDLDGVLEAAQYARSAQAPGDVLFRERYLAMGEEERARIKPAELAQKLAPQDFLEVMQGASGGIDEGQRSRMQSFVQAVKPILGAVTLGEYATPQENERDRRLLELIRDEVRIQTADQEKEKGRELSAWEYENLMRDAVGISLLRHERSELERRGMAWPDMVREVQ